MRLNLRGYSARAAAAGAALLLCLAAEGLAAQSSTAGSLIVSGDFRTWLPNFDGMIKLGTAEVPGSENRFKHHLNLEPQPEAYEFLLSLGDYRYGKITFGYLWFEAPGHKVLNRDVSFAGETFYAPETVRPEFSINISRLTVSYIQSYQGNYMLVYEVGVAQYNWRMDIANRHNGHLVSERSTLNLPLTGLHAVLDLNYLRIMLGFSGVLFNTSGDSVNAMDTYFEVDLVIAKFFLLGLGYKHQNVSAELEIGGNKTGRLEYNAGGFYAVIGLKL